MIELRGRHFVSELEFTPEELRAIVDLALAMKRRERFGSLPGAVLGMMFFNPSVRTRVSCEAAMAKMGGQAVALTPGKDTWNFEAQDGAVMDRNTQEHVRELAPVLSSYCDAIGIRKSELITTGLERADVTKSWDSLKQDEFLRRFAHFAKRPVINLESNSCHPLQGLADMAILQEKLRDPRKKKYVLTWASHPKPLPVATPHSQLLAAATLGMDVTLLHPFGYDLDPAYVTAARERAEASGGSLTVTNDQRAAYTGAVAVCAKSWGALRYYGRYEEEEAVKRTLLPHWTVDAQKMAWTNDAIFMHCLPVRRNVVVKDEVLDSPNSVVVEQAEHRMWTVMALLQMLIAG